MTFSRGVLSVSILVLSTFGAGCFVPPQSQRVAEPLIQTANPDVIAPQNGFGTLPAIPSLTGQPTITFAQPLPTLPTKITVIRLRSGNPSETELRNLAAAIHLPGGIIGNRTFGKETLLQWTDDQRISWSYRASQQLLDFSFETAPSAPYTTFQLPTNDNIIQTADAFLTNHGIQLQRYRNGLVEPDWNLWWIKGKEQQRCMDNSTLYSVREIASSASLLSGSPPSLPFASSTTCTGTEFPARVVVRYHAMMDELDVVQPTGEYVQGVELMVDTLQNNVISGKITLMGDAERSDYTALNAQQVIAALQKGGLTGTSGNLTLQTYSIVLRKINQYLIPSLKATGSRITASGALEPIQLVVPLLSR